MLGLHGLGAAHAAPASSNPLDLLLEVKGNFGMARQPVGCRVVVP